MNIRFFDDVMVKPQQRIMKQNYTHVYHVQIIVVGSEISKALWYFKLTLTFLSNEWMNVCETKYVQNP